MKTVPASEVTGFPKSPCSSTWKLTIAAVYLGMSLGAAASGLQEMYSFPLAPDVRSKLAEGNDGAFYGTTLGGGANGLGSVFRATTNGDFNTIISFDGTNGVAPSATLLKGSDGAFYGTTLGGGTNNCGTIFRLTEDGMLTTVVTFETNPRSPSVLFLGSDGTFYGMSYQLTKWNFTNAPTYDYSIFRLTSNQLTTVASFTGIGLSDVIQASDGAFYGTTQQGGDFGFGTIFRVTTNGGLSTMFSFDGTNGSYVNPGLVQGLDGRLYGTTERGGNNDLGVVFALGTDGSLTDLVSLSDPTVVVYAQAPMIQGMDGALYGTSQVGGNWGYGDVFRVTTNGEFSVLGSFDQTNGDSPYAAPVEGSDGAFYGTTHAGGTQGYGTVFKMTPTGAIVSLASFTHSDAVEPILGLVQGTNRDFYGTTYFGGTNNAGTIFRITSGGMEKMLISFQDAENSSVGPFPSGLVRAADGNFYGTTQRGGTNGFGTVFRMSETGSLTTIATFDGTNSSNPSGRLLCGPDGAFYGTTELGKNVLTTSGWIYSYGTVFRVTTNGEITTLAQFFETNGSYAKSPRNPNGDLVQDRNGNLYGMTAFGGGGMTNGLGGTVFRLSTNGELTTLVAFNGTNGMEPRGGLVQGDDGAFYGTTLMGGQFNAGTIFRITANGELTTLVNFNGTNGARPVGGLIIGPDGTFYGTATFSYNGAGTLFRITTNGFFATVASFDDSTGGSPEGALLLGQDGMFYGTAAGGGSHGGGTVFRLSLAAQLLPLTRVGPDWIVSFSGIPDQSYQLLRASDLSGPWETLTNLTAGDDGQGRYTDSSPPADKAFYRMSFP